MLISSMSCSVAFVAAPVERFNGMVRCAFAPSSFFPATTCTCAIGTALALITPEQGLAIQTRIGTRNAGGDAMDVDARLQARFLARRLLVSWRGIR